MGKLVYLDERGSAMKMRTAIRHDEVMNNMIEITKLVLFFANNTEKAFYKTKLHKLLFYTQFQYFKKYGKYLITEDFVCDYYGPTMNGLDNYLMQMESADIIKLIQTNYGTAILPKVKISDNEYDDEELEILKKINDKFSSFTAQEISQYSHNEKLWCQENLKQIIDIERAYEINEF